MDETDTALIAHLRRDGRASIATLAATVGVSRATVRARLEKLQVAGVIAGFSVRLREEELEEPVRGLTLIKIAGHRTERIVDQLHRITAIRRIHSTNGRWDLIVELATATLADFDAALSTMRGIDGISESETNLLLGTRGKGQGSRRA